MNDRIADCLIVFVTVCNIETFADWKLILYFLTKSYLGITLAYSGIYIYSQKLFHPKNYYIDDSYFISKQNKIAYRQSKNFGTDFLLVGKETSFYQKCRITIPIHNQHYRDVQTNIARYVLCSTKLDLLHKTLAMCMELVITPKS